MLPLGPGDPRDPLMNPLPRWAGLLEEGLPLTRRPFRDLGASLGTGETALLEEVRRFAAEDPRYRGFRAVWSARAFGFAGALCAFLVPRSRVEGICGTLAGFPGVTHGYLREHRMNLWLTLQAPDEKVLREDARRLRSLLGAEEGVVLPARRVFKLRARFAPSGSSVLFREEEEVSPWGEEPSQERRTILVTRSEEGFPLEAEPFDALGEAAGLEGERVLAFFRRSRDRRRLLRVGLTLRHRLLGWRENLLVGWQVPESRLERVGQAASACPRVSHCYARGDAPGWPYNLYAMLHARTEGELRDLLAWLEGRVLPTDRVLLPTREELRKTGGCVGSLLARRGEGD